ncbi:hypothetical protein PYK79_57395 [Streptomyces sp. ID05-04B]|uniref:hypothetical protein n=1 Tax=unclassified Streptomyces TaxID=2593676 RepID=UPI000D19F6F8|nr:MULTISPECIES: hypothetical protein [unclassified Streptomyces]AVV40954.1 hypothetical protein C6376_05400 [Streptomyces sp. P3]MDX5570971.1 hypothetical protein [Streptomyces sp. ID05-04B]
MTIKVSLEVSAEELPALIDVLAAHGAEFDLRTTSRQAAAPEPSVLDPEVLALIRTRAASQYADLFVSFVEKEVREHGAVAELGTEKTSYVKLYVPGPRKVGAYCYVRPDRTYLDFRLPGDAAEGCRFAAARNVQADNAHAVRLPLTTSDALPEAYRLARRSAAEAEAA